MKILQSSIKDLTKIKTLFNKTFSHSGGKREGKVISDLVVKMTKLIDDKDVLAFQMLNQNKLIAAIFFSRLFYKNTNLNVFVLAPVATDPQFQRQGIAKKLIQHGLKKLKKKTDIIVTYGDPKVYQSFGFKPVSEKRLPACYKLKYPFGWQMIKLKSKKIPQHLTKPNCITPLKNKKYW